jgi:hypothetical protein
MQLPLRWRLGVIDLIGIAIGSLLAGRAAATLIAGALPPRHVTPPPWSAAPPPRAMGAAHGTSIEAIVGRNIFCPTRPEASRRPSRTDAR